jgi:hypothetical protein
MKKKRKRKSNKTRKKSYLNLKFQNSKLKTKKEALTDKRMFCKEHSANLRSHPNQRDVAVLIFSG